MNFRWKHTWLVNCSQFNFMKYFTNLQFHAMIGSFSGKKSAVIVTWRHIIPCFPFFDVHWKYLHHQLRKIHQTTPPFQWLPKPYHQWMDGILFTYIYQKNQPNLGKYTSPMHGMGEEIWWCPPSPPLLSELLLLPVQTCSVLRVSGFFKILQWEI